MVDTVAMRLAARLGGLDGAHGVALGPGGRVYVSSSKARTVSIFDPATQHMTGSVTADDDTAAVVYDPVSRHVFAMNDDAGNVTVIDTVTGKHAATIALGDGEGIGSAAADGHGHIYVSHAAAREVVRISTRDNLIDATWKLPGCAAPQGLAIDTASRRVVVSCAEGAVLVLNAQDGRVVAHLPTASGSGTVLFDARQHRIYVLNAAGTASVIGAQGPDRYVAQADLITAPGARTGALDPATGRLFLVTADVTGQAPARKPGALPGFRFAPGTVKLLVFSPAP